MSNIVMVQKSLSETDPRTASEICHMLPLTLRVVDDCLRELSIYGCALAYDGIGPRARWVSLP